MRKDIFTKFICLISFLFICFCAVKIFMRGGGKNITASSFSGGSGTQASPYLIKTVADLNQLASDNAESNQYENKYFRLDADINLNGATFNSIYHFENSTFDGNGHVIKNYSTTLPLFFCNHGSTIKNLGVTNVTMNIPDRTFDGLAIVDNKSNNNYLGIIGGGVGSTTGLKSIVYENCFIDNSFLTVEQQTQYTRWIVGGFFSGLLPGDSKISNCYISNGTYRFNSSKLNRAAEILSRYFQASSSESSEIPSIECCFVSGRYSSSCGYIPHFGGTGYTKSYCYVSGYEYNNGEISILSDLKPYDLSNSYRLSTNAGHPVLKVFDPDMTLIYANDVQTHTIYKNHETSGLTVTANLSRTLNVQGQNDKIAFYFDDETTPILTPSTSNQITIPASTLNNLSVGTHKVKAMILDDTELNLPVKSSQNELNLIVEDSVYPEIEKIDIVPTGHSKSQSANLNSITVTLTGRNFTSEYNADLIFKNESGTQVLGLELGNLGGNDTTTKIFTISGNKLDEIKNLDVAKYSVEVEVSR